MCFSLSEFIQKIDIIPARRKAFFEDPKNENIFKSISGSTFIFLGPGSPTYTVNELKDTLFLGQIINKWHEGAGLCLSSAAALAFGKYVLPVYEIYKAGSDLYWLKGINILDILGSITFIPHWNNNSGGLDLDTRYCFMGEERFIQLKSILKYETKYLGVDENTIAVFDFNKMIFEIEGKGMATYIYKDKIMEFKPGDSYGFEVLL